MPTLRLLADVPEGAAGDVRIVSDARARDLIRIGQAELAPAADAKAATGRQSGRSRRASR